MAYILYFLATFEFTGFITISDAQGGAWKIVGLLGMATFSGRFILQWLASERAGKSVIPFGFWECSAIGSILMLSYFWLGKNDAVGVLQNLVPLPIYLRNLYFRYTHKIPKHPGNAPRPPE